MADQLWCDVSWWNGQVDFNKMKAAGARGVILRLGSINNSTGVCYEDREFRRNVVEAPKVFGSSVGGYWFMRPNHDPIKQAHFAIALLVQFPVIKFLADDIEVAGQFGPVNVFNGNIAAFYGTKKKAPIYTNPNTWLYLLSGDKSWANQYPLWQGQWGVSVPSSLAPWTAEQRVAWQYSANGNHLGAQYGNGPAYNSLTGKYDAKPTVNMDLNKVNEDWVRDVCGVVPQPVTLEARVGKLEAEARAHGWAI